MTDDTEQFCGNCDCQMGCEGRPAPIPPFSDQDRAILELERIRFHTSGGKTAEIQSRFAMTPVTYYVRLNWIINQPEAEAYDSVLVHRLQRLRDRRRDVRTRGTIAAGETTRSDTRGIRPAVHIGGTP